MRLRKQILQHLTALRTAGNNINRFCRTESLLCQSALQYMTQIPPMRGVLYTPCAASTLVPRRVLLSKLL